MKIKAYQKHAFSTLEQRTAFAAFVAKFFATSGTDHGTPYPVTPTEEYEFVVDRENNWKVVFDRNDDTLAFLVSRTGDSRLEESATYFIAHRYGANLSP